MVKLAATLIFLTAFDSLLFANIPAKDLPTYKIGDTAKKDVVTPAPLTVIDPDGTETLRQEEAKKVPAVFRFNPQASDEAEASFRSAFDNRRSNFLDKVEEVFTRRTLSARDIALPRFQRLMVSFRKQHKLFPLSTNLAELWARGDSDAAIEDAFAAKLRGTMSLYIRADTLPPDIKLGPRARIFLWPTNAAKLDLDTIERQPALSVRGNLFPLARAKTNLQGSFGPGEVAAAKFVASFLRKNCELDAPLTRLVRSKYTDPLSVTNHYEAGQVIVRGGQLVDAKARAALDQLREQLRLSEIQQQAEADRRKSEEIQQRASTDRVSAEQSRQRVEQIHRRNLWLIAALICVSLISLVTVWRLRRRRKPPAGSLAPARILHADHSAAVISCPACAENIFLPLVHGSVETTISSDADTQAWRRRALAAEHRADRAVAVVRAGLLPHMAHWMKHVFTEKLLRQHTAVLDTQQKAAAEMVELEKRLEQMHAPLQERMKAYEKRIAELEKDLAAKGEENRELIKAKIAMARRQLEAERAKSPVVLN